MDNSEDNENWPPPAPDPEASDTDTATPPAGWPTPPLPPVRVQGRYSKGSSGNPKGRPPKRVRPSSKRELMREFLAEMERVIEVGGTKMTVTRVLISQRIMAAAKGDQKESAKLLTEYEKVLSELAALNEEDAKMLEAVERRLGHREGEITDREVLDFLYEARKKARKL